MNSNLCIAQEHENQKQPDHVIYLGVHDIDWLFLYILLFCFNLCKSQDRSFGIVHMGASE